MQDVRKLDLQQIHYILTIAESESMTAAAEKLFVSQSALSMSYKKLERELGVSLFYRSGRNLALTHAGEVFCSKARVVLADFEDLQGVMREIAAEEAQRISICTEAVDFTNEVIKLYIKSAPGVYINQIRGSRDEIRSLLLAKKADFAITLSSEFGPELQSELLLEEPMAAQVCKNGKYAGRTEISLSELADERIVTLREGFGLRRLFDSFFEAANISSVRVEEVNDPETIGMQVGLGFGVSFVPERVIDMSALEYPGIMDNIQNLPISDASCIRRIWLVTDPKRKINSNSTRFIRLLQYLGKYVHDHKSYPSDEMIRSEFGHLR